MGVVGSTEIARGRRRSSGFGGFVGVVGRFKRGGDGGGGMGFDGEDGGEEGGGGVRVVCGGEREHGIHYPVALDN